MSRLFVGQIVLIGEKGKALPDYLGKLTKVGSKEIHFRAFRLVDEYYLNDGYVLKYKNEMFPDTMTAPRSYVMKRLIDVPKDFEVVVEKI